MPTLISFGPDQPPHEDTDSAVRGPTGAQPDVLIVAEGLEEVAADLGGPEGGWAALTEIRGEERRRVVVNARAVRFVAESD